MKRSQLPEIMQDCLSDERTSYRLTEPFGLNGMVYATNGAIMARMAGDYPPNKKAPDPLGLPWGRDKYEDEPTMLPTTFAKPWEDCTSCDGYGSCVCDKCDHDHDCAKCEGGRVKRSDTVTLGESGYVILTYWFAYFLNARGVHEVFLPKDQTKKLPVRFEFGKGGEGLVMVATEKVEPKATNAT